ncbi:MAG: hypothetical protein KJ709_04920, partial [Nanoarchaeota archaeon]|nr:hypothetical protein [Nanoarchaeota archaeon]
MRGPSMKDAGLVHAIQPNKFADLYCSLREVMYNGYEPRDQSDHAYMGLVRDVTRMKDPKGVMVRFSSRTNNIRDKYFHPKRHNKLGFMQSAEVERGDILMVWPEYSPHEGRYFSVEGS